MPSKVSSKNTWPRIKPVSTLHKFCWSMIEFQTESSVSHERVKSSSENSLRMIDLT